MWLVWQMYDCIHDLHVLCHAVKLSEIWADEYFVRMGVKDRLTFDRMIATAPSG